jgi:hypothetical protein
VIQRELSRALVLNPLWQNSPVLRTGHHNFALTTPSFLSRGTLGVIYFDLDLERVVGGIFAGEDKGGKQEE